LKSNRKLSSAIVAVLSVHTAAAYAQQQTAGAVGGSESIADIVVTAQRRSENVQDVPITIQALTSDTLSQLNVATIDDFIKYLPNVTTGSMGPGQNTIFMRGLSTGVLGTQGQGSVGNFPNVAVYLDDQSTQLPGRNLDIYAADLERIEVLEGPQGTLFGAGAQAGVIRYITNKPKLNVTEGEVNAGYGITAHGDNNSNAEAMINLPLIQDTLAIRAVIYNDSRGGYINNVPSTFSRASTDLGLARYNGGVVPTNSVSINNYDIAGNAINPLTYQGFRVSALMKFNDSWDALLTQSYQNMNAQGVFYEMPNGSDGVVLDSRGNPSGGQPLPPLSVTLFNPSYDKDRFENTSLTVDGKIGDLKFVYSGAYLVRNVEQAQDYTNYARGVFGYYYQCAGYSSKSAAAGQCYTPSSLWTDTEENIHQSHEVRLSTPDDWRVRGLVGLYWEKQQVDDDTEWLYKSVPDCSPTGLNVNCFLPLVPWPGGGNNNPNERNANTGFFDDFQRGYTQKAAFGSVDFELVPKTLTLTLGTRYYKIDNHTYGGDVGSFYCKAFSPTTYFGPCLTPYGTDLNTQNPNSLTAKGFKSRGNLSWKVMDNFLVYYTWSQGFRPGGFNRGSSCHLPDAQGVDQYCTPKSYLSDDLTNNEFGWKTEWFGRRLQFNGTVYQEDWKNVQVGFFDPQGGLGNLTFGTNGPNYRVRGLELQVVARVTTGLTVQGAASWNSTNETNSPYLIDNNPATPNYGQNITSIPNPYGPIGSPLANSPPFQGNIRVRDEWAMNDYTAFWQVGGQHQAHSLSATGFVEAYDQPGFSTYDAALGVGKGAWTLQLVGENLTDTNASLFTSSRQFVITETPMRPRTLALRFGYKFTEK
jgi:outer membrane receptor protein involved in Fe transport